MRELCEGVARFDVVFLNAGTLGRIQDTSATSLAEMKAQMDVNVWANKVILDFLIDQNVTAVQLIAISSGASISGNLGWNGYSLSKAALNMLVKLYAHEMHETHLCALAPGLVGTPMLRSILDGDQDTVHYPTVSTLRQSERQGLVQEPAACAARIHDILPTILDHPSGEYIDIRKL